jgi:type I restriction enzyme, S subunit
MNPGYKQIEVGVIPEGWKCTNVRGIASSARNAIVGGPFGSDLVSADYVAEGVPVIRGQNMGGQWVSGPFVFVTPQKAKSLEANLARPGDIVFTQRGTLGQVSLVPEKPLPSYLVSQSQMKLTVNRDVADPLFFFYVFTSEGQQELIRGRTIQTGVPHINLGILRGIPVQLPPLSEQRAIAEALSDVDALLGELDGLIAKKRDLKQAAMQQLLSGQIRLPGFHAKWNTLPAREIGSFRGGNGFPLKEQGEESGTYPFFKVSDMNNEGNETFMTTSNHWISEQTRKRLGANAFPADSIVFAKVGAAVFLERKKILGQPSCIDNNMAAFVLDKSRADVRFIHTLLLNKKLGNLVATTALPSINGKQLGEMALAIPPLPEQIAIATVLADMDAELVAMDQRWEKTRSLKQAMMQELLTGSTRLVSLEPAHA